MKVKLEFPLDQKGLAEYFEEFEFFAEQHEPDFDLDSYKPDELLDEIKDAFRIELMDSIAFDIEWHFDRIFEVEE